MMVWYTKLIITITLNIKFCADLICPVRVYVAFPKCMNGTHSWNGTPVNQNFCTTIMSSAWGDLLKSGTDMGPCLDL